MDVCVREGVDDVISLPVVCIQTKLKSHWLHLLTSLAQKLSNFKKCHIILSRGPGFGS